MLVTSKSRLPVSSLFHHTHTYCCSDLLLNIRRITIPLLSIRFYVAQQEAQLQFPKTILKNVDPWFLHQQVFIYLQVQVLYDYPYPRLLFAKKCMQTVKLPLIGLNSTTAAHFLYGLLQCNIEISSFFQVQLRLMPVTIKSSCSEIYNGRVLLLYRSSTCRPTGYLIMILYPNCESPMTFCLWYL